MVISNQTEQLLEWGDYEPAQFDENGEPVDVYTHDGGSDHA